MIEQLRTVMLCKGNEDGARFNAVLDTKGYVDEYSLDKLASSAEYVHDITAWLSWSSYAMCAVLGPETSISSEYLNRYGYRLMEAWTYAYGDYRCSNGSYRKPSGRTSDGVWVVDLDARECVRVDRFGEPCVLPYLLYVGSDSVCCWDRAGSWAFDALSLSRTKPEEYEDVSNVVPWL